MPWGYNNVVYIDTQINLLLYEFLHQSLATSFGVKHKY